MGVEFGRDVCIDPGRKIGVADGPVRIVLGTETAVVDGIGRGWAQQLHFVQRRCVPVARVVPQNSINHADAHVTGRKMDCVRGEAVRCIGRAVNGGVVDAIVADFDFIFVVSFGTFIHEPGNVDFGNRSG